MSALASADAVTWLSIILKTLTYATTLVAVGSVFVAVGLRELSPDGRAALGRMALLAAILAAALSVLRIPVRASFLMGGTLDGAMDPMMLAIVAESPLGTSVMVRLAGLALILAILLPVRAAKWIALVGAVVTCASFALRGHALNDPRVPLSVLVTLHIAGLAFWIGAFAPLSRAAKREPPGTAAALSHEFGTKALWVVAALVAAGAATLALLGAARPGAISTPYGQAFLVKLGLFAGVLALAALNKLWLTPGLQAGARGAGRRLRASIGVESLLIVAILAATATLTTTTSPPSEAARSTQD